MSPAESLSSDFDTNCDRSDVPASVAVRVHDLAEVFAEDARRGHCPTVEQYAGQHPDLADEIRQWQEERR